MPHIETRTNPFLAQTAPKGRSLAAGLFHALVQARARRHERNGLARLDDRMLRDIGLDPEIALAECRKPFWQP